MAQERYLGTGDCQSLQTADRLLTVQQVANIIGQKVNTLNRARLTGAPAPPFIKVGASVRYKLSSVMNWIAAQTEHQSTSEAAVRKG
ncbi:hypothetical protein GMLC_41750 [Geomonas limicola]|uniref:Uncharacterized protein n=2 Tax=Geomonas TaxID=2651583 RepID=A0A6V8MQ78_9BACT|nr:hypothetical protein GMST_43420 [Geomonas silvestris]GFO70596.1 hypothetical protein GMLC_41750 [Geomonas limicola]